MAKMKVLLVSPCRGTFGGIESFVCSLTEELQKHEGVEVGICFKKVSNYVDDPSLRQAMERVAVKPAFVEKASKALFEQLKWADIVHLQNAPPDAAVLTRLAGKPLVTTIYNRYGVGTKAHRMLWKMASRLAHRRWYISDFVWSTWEPGGRRKGSDKLPIISNLPEGWTPPAERKGFVFVGRWIRNKGLEELIEAYGTAKIDHAKWPLLLMGRGPLQQEVEEMIKRFNITTAEMPGFVSDEERNRRIRNSKWMVTPPKTREDLGLTPIESRHVGVPAIVTRDGGLEEAGGKLSLYCEPGDVAGLRARLEEAAAMPEADYAKLSEDTHKELMEYLKPLSLYVDHYRQVIAEVNH